jgi:uncharacterized membrane protein
MFHSTLVLFHVCNAVVGLLSGFLSTLFQNGSGLHRVAGNIFFVSMLIFWMVRVRVRKRVPQDNVTAVRQGDEVIVRKAA